MHDSAISQQLACFHGNLEGGRVWAGNQDSHFQGWLVEAPGYNQFNLCFVGRSLDMVPDLGEAKHVYCI